MSRLRSVDCEAGLKMIPGDRGKVGTGWLARPPQKAIQVAGWGHNSPVPLTVFAHCQSREKELGGQERLEAALNRVK
jgi:hypothetical protein